MDVTEADQVAIRTVVEKQLQAFQDEDWATAFALASPDIQRQFKTLANFKRMVKVGYHPVYRPRSVVFEGLTRMQGKPTLQVMLLSAHRHLFRGFYVMERDAIQEWRISGCHLVPLEDGHRRSRH
jgi:hypothetical protein